LSSLHLTDTHTTPIYTLSLHDALPISFTLSLAEIELEKVPGMGEVGFKLDLALGGTQDIIFNTVKGSLAPDKANHSVQDYDRNVQHASISYLAPIGRGLRLDFGKFVTHIGAE